MVQNAFPAQYHILKKSVKHYFSEINTIMEKFSTEDNDKAKVILSERSVVSPCIFADALKSAGYVSDFGNSVLHDIHDNLCIDLMGDNYDLYYPCTSSFVGK